MNVPYGTGRVVLQIEENNMLRYLLNDRGKITPSHTVKQKE